MVDGNAKEKATFLKIFLIFAKIGAFTIGGGYAMIPLIQNEMVRRGWLEEKEFPDLIALSQTAPGILAVNISIFVGYKLRGTKGSIVATLGSILPSFLIILIIAIAFTGYQDNPKMVALAHYAVCAGNDSFPRHFTYIYNALRNCTCGGRHHI